MAAKKSKPQAKPVKKPIAKAQAKTVKSVSKPVAKKVSKPVSKSKPIINKISASKSKPIINKASAKSRPIINRIVASKSKPVINRAAASKSKPIINKASAKSRPIINRIVASKSKPIINKASASKSKPIINKASLAKSKPIINKASLAKSKPIINKASASKSKPIINKATAKSVVVKPAPKPNIMPPSKSIINKPGKKAIAIASPVKLTNGIKSKQTSESKVQTYTRPTQAVKAPAAPPSQFNADGSEKMRYSDTELQEFRKLIVRKLDEARAEYILQQQQMNSANEHGTDDTASTFKMLEDGSDTLAKEEASQLASRQRKFIEQLESALMRVENKTYGICRVTGKLIPKERLRAVPHTTQSIEAKLLQYRD